jgi:hypothetical protein
MGHTFRTRYKEQVRAIRYNKDDCKFASYILIAGHFYGPKEQTVEVLHSVNKSHYMATVERYYIYQHNHDDNLLNEVHSSMHNPIFNMLYKYNYPPPTNSPVQT